MDDENLRDNHEQVGRALNGIVRDNLAGFIGQTLSTFYRPDWWFTGVLSKLRPEQRRDVLTKGTYAQLTDSMDIQLCVNIINANWQDVFRSKLTENQRSWLGEIRAIRNDWAHNKLDKFTNSDVERALDTMARICEIFNDDDARDLWSELSRFRARHISKTDELDDANKLFFQQPGELPSWREVMQPNPDVQDGTFKVAEFAADLAQVVAGTSKLVEYQNATEFFARTYLTVGMRRLLLESINRLVNGNGEPMIEVKTSFGGGKTHSMMALWHLFNRKYRLSEVDVGIQNLFDDARIRELPNDIRLAVVVGTDLNTERAKDIPELDGVQIHTLMGEIFTQLARAAGRFDLYQKYIRLNDERGTSPGVADLRAFLDECGACLILIDELVAYGKKLYGGVNRSSGTFDGFIVFLQELSEAVRTSNRSLLVASLPQSEIEIGDSDGGYEVLRVIEHHFGRLQSVWSPVEAQESFEIVRRRLFIPCRREQTRDEVCSAFASMYRRSSSYPLDTKEKRYVDRLRSCYPIHPQLFDLLYEKWATIETFQRTRGVLRLMATVVHKLWQYEDQLPMIMPSTIPLLDAEVRNELTRYLPSNWSSIINTEIDGEDSIPRKLEHTESAQRMQSARRLTRTIFMGSAPTARGQNVRGLDEREIMLGVMMPQDKKTSMFKDMLDKLKEKLTYMYSNESHCWYDGRPTLRKVAEAMEAGITETDLEYDIIDQLEAEFKIGRWFTKKYITDRLNEIPDLDTVRLVIFPPSVPWEKRGNEQPNAEKVAEKILSLQREDVPRKHKNTLIFLAGNGQGVESLKKLLRQLKTWRRLFDEREERNFDQKQLAEIQSNITKLEKAERIQLSYAYNMMMSPGAKRADDMKVIQWRIRQLNCSGLNNIDMLGEQLRSDDALFLTFEPAALMRELEEHMFKRESHVSLKEAWEFHTQYFYAARLINCRVMLDAVRDGVLGGAFGLAESFDEATGKYIDLKFGTPTQIGSMDQLLVRRQEAEAQKLSEAPPVEEVPTVESSTDEFEEDVIQGDPDPTRFALALGLDLDQPDRGLKRCMEEIVDILRGISGVEVTLELMVRARVADGIPEQERDTLKDNGEQLNARIIRFDY